MGMDLSYISTKLMVFLIWQPCLLNWASCKWLDCHVSLFTESEKQPTSKAERNLRDDLLQILHSNRDPEWENVKTKPKAGIMSFMENVSLLNQNWESLSLEGKGWDAQIKPILSCHHGLRSKWCGPQFSASHLLKRQPNTVILSLPRSWSSITVPHGVMKMVFTATS